MSNSISDKYLELQGSDVQGRSTHEQHDCMESSDPGHLTDILDLKGRQNSTAQTLSSDSTKWDGLNSGKVEATKFTTIQRVTSILSSIGPRRSTSQAGPHPHARPWKTALVRFGPLLGIFSMFLAIAALVASLGVLAGSNSSPFSHWTAPPSTYLAIFTALANMSMRYAAIQGVVIAWWFRACKGSTLAKLHWDWRSGTTLIGKVLSPWLA